MQLSRRPFRWQLAWSLSAVHVNVPLWRAYSLLAAVILPLLLPELENREPESDEQQSAQRRANAYASFGAGCGALVLEDDFCGCCGIGRRRSATTR